ncbi:MAG: hypothetical protein Q4D58_12080 [Synergistaceae bacterium]|nr:hypothetical protein [Synergistaceae bacterium]
MGKPADSHESKAFGSLAASRREPEDQGLGSFQSLVAMSPLLLP